MIQSVLEVHDVDKLDKWGFKVHVHGYRVPIIVNLKEHFGDHEWVAFPKPTSRHTWCWSYVWFREETIADYFAIYHKLSRT